MTSATQADHLRRRRIIEIGDGTDNGLPGGTRKLFITRSGPGGTPYPVDSIVSINRPNVYYCEEITNLSYTQSAGEQVLSFTASGNFEHVLNVTTHAYLPEGTVLIGWKINDRWFTFR